MHYLDLFPEDEAWLWQKVMQANPLLHFRFFTTTNNIAIVYLKGLRSWEHKDSCCRTKNGPKEKMWGTWTAILSLLFSLPVASPDISPGCVFWGWLQLHSWVQACGWCLQSPLLYFPLVVTCVWEYEHAQGRKLNKIIVWTADCWYHPSNCEGFYSDAPRTAPFYHMRLRKLS